MATSRTEVDCAIKTIRDRYGALSDPDYITVDEDHEVVGFSFPDSDGSDYDFEEVITATAELDRLTVDLTNGRVITPSCFYQLVESDSYESYQLLESQPADARADGVAIGLRRCPLQVALVALQHDAWIRHAWAPDSYTAIEVKPTDGKPLDSERALQFVERYLFELAAGANAVFGQTGFVDESSAYPEAESEVSLYLDDLGLEQHNDGMRLYLAAVQVTDPELALLSLYKVLEYFAPVAAGLEAADAMRRRLDTGRSQLNDGAFIQSLLELARSFEARRNDKDMMISVFSAALDIVRLADLLPASIRPMVTDSSKRGDIAAASRSIAEALVATRNQVAHAKANYSSTGKEVRIEDIPQFNRFVRAAAESAIRWYNRLPEHQRSLAPST